MRKPLPLQASGRGPSMASSMEVTYTCSGAPVEGSGYWKPICLFQKGPEDSGFPHTATKIGVQASR